MDSEVRFNLDRTEYDAEVEAVHRARVARGDKSLHMSQLESSTRTQDNRKRNPLFSPHFLNEQLAQYEFPSQSNSEVLMGASSPAAYKALANKVTRASMLEDGRTPSPTINDAFINPYATRKTSPAPAASSVSPTKLRRRSPSPTYTRLGNSGRSMSPTRSPSPTKQLNQSAEHQGEPSPGENTVAFFAKNKDGPVKFVYMQQVNDANGLRYTPYSLKLVDQKDIQGEYYTMSPNGVVHVGTDGRTEFTPMAQWVRESELFNMISHLSVFKNFRYWKSFTLWRKYVRRRRYKTNRALLDRAMFVQRTMFLPTLMELVRDVLQLDASTLFAIKLHAGYSPSEFVDALNHQRKATKELYHTYLDKAVAAVDRMAQAVCSSERIQVNDDDFQQNVRRNMGLRQIMLIEKQKALEKSRLTQEVNSEIRRIGNFIRLVDYIITEQMVGLVMRELQEFLNVLCTDKSTVFKTEIVFTDNPPEAFTGDSENSLGGEIAFSPDLVHLRRMVHGVVEETIATLSALPRVLYYPQFRKYLKLSGMDARELATMGPSVKSFLDVTPAFIRMEGDAMALLERCYADAVIYAKGFQEFLPVYRFGRKWDVRKYASAEVDLAVFGSDMATFTKWIGDMARIQTSSSRGVLIIDSKAFKNTLVPIPSTAAEDVKKLLTEIASERTAALYDRLHQNIIRLNTEPTDLDEFVQYVDFLKDMPDASNDFMREAQQIDDMYNLLDDYKAVVSTQDVHKHSLIHTTFTRFKDVLSTGQQVRTKFYNSYLRALERNVLQVDSVVEQLVSRLSGGEFVAPDTHPQPLLEQLEEIRSQMNDLKRRAERLAEYQRVLEVAINAARPVGAAMALLDKTENLWSMIAEWQEMVEAYRMAPFTSFRTDEMVADMRKTMGEAEALVNTVGPDNAVASTLLRQVEYYRALLPSLVNLANPAMKTRHWEKIFEGVGVHYDEESEALTLKRLMDLNVFANRELIAEVSATATGEATIDEAINKIRITWRDLRLDTVPFGERGTAERSGSRIVVNIDTVLATLEDNEIALLGILESEYISGIRDEVDALKQRLGQVYETMDAWRECQANWVFMEPIMAQDTVQQQLPAQTRRFRAADRRWKGILKELEKDATVFGVAAIPGLHPLLVDCNNVLEATRRSLAEYVDARRAVFPRFHFLSDEEILHVMSQSSNVSLIQQQLPKLFADVAHLEMGTGGGTTREVTALISAEGERLPLQKPIRVEGSVEDWLRDVEMMMRKSLALQLGNAVASYEKMPRDEWVFSYPSQIVTTAIQINWTREVHWAMEAFETNMMRKYKKQLRQQITQLAELTRSSTLTALQRTTLSALLTTNIHLLETIARLIETNCSSDHHYEWQRQLRHYWDADTEQCVVRQFNGSLQYGYEFLGTCTRPVVTPQTERSVAMLTTALNQSMVGAVFGPVGCGKREIVKELSRTLGRLFVEFSLNADVPSKILGRFIAGIAQSGAWGFFRNVASLKQGVLSVFAQQLRTILQALQLRVEKVLFENHMLPLNHNSGIFVSLDPPTLLQLHANGLPPISDDNPLLPETCVCRRRGPPPQLL